MEKTNILAIDPSTHMGVVVLSVDTQRMTATPLEAYEFHAKGKGMPRLAQLGTEVLRILGAYNIDRVVIEGYSFASRHAIVTMAEVGTVIRYFLYQEGYEYREVAPPSLKKFVTGKGNCKKDLILLNVYKNWGFETDNDNVADAFSLAMYEAAYIVGATDAKGVPSLHKLKKLHLISNNP